MKVYVSELPKGKDIRCEIDGMVLAIDISDKDKSYLMIGDKEQDNNFRVEFCSDNEVLVNCVAKTLEHLSDYTKQVRKEVLAEVEKRIINYCRRQDKKPFQKPIEQIKVDLLTSINQIQEVDNA